MLHWVCASTIGYQTGLGLWSLDIDILLVGSQKVQIGIDLGGADDL